MIKSIDSFKYSSETQVQETEVKAEDEKDRGGNVPVEGQTEEMQSSWISSILGAIFLTDSERGGGK